MNYGDDDDGQKGEKGQMKIKNQKFTNYNRSIRIEKPMNTRAHTHKHNEEIEKKFFFGLMVLLLRNKFVVTHTHLKREEKKSLQQTNIQRMNE